MAFLLSAATGFDRSNQVGVAIVLRLDGSSAGTTH
jgi:hypothetical protein